MSATKTATGRYTTGFCNSGAHASCRHVLRLATGVWEQLVCRCPCHGPTDELDVRREADA